MKSACIIGFAVVVLVGCGLADRPQQQVSIRGMVFGTYYSIIYYDEDKTDFSNDIDSILLEFNRSLSFYDEHSLLSKINRNQETVPDDYFISVFTRAREISAETGGAFDATVFPLVNAWGFGTSGRAEMTARKIDSLMQFVGYGKIWLEDGHVRKADPRVQLDFNAIAKGYAADVIGMFLESVGVVNYLVEIGGDLVAKGIKPDGTRWRIGLEIPAEDAYEPQTWDYFVEIEDAGLATSGDYRRYYEEGGQRFSHTIDPSTGYPVTHHMMSVSVFAPDGMSADAYATACMVMGLEKAIDFIENHSDLEAYFIFARDDDEGFGYYASSGLVLMSRDDL